MPRKPIRVITQDFELLTEIDRYTSLQVTRSWHGIGELELHINRHITDAHLLQKGVLLIVGADLHKVYIIRSREIQLDSNGKASENWTITAPALKDVLGQRITLPPSHTAYDNKQGAAEEVMKHYVRTNVTQPDDANRTISTVSIATDQQRGDTLSWQSRFKNLTEELTQQSKASALGWNVSLDLGNAAWLFDVHEGRDLTASQNTNPPVIFSPQFDSLRSLDYSESMLEYRNAAYTAGQGEGTERRVLEVGSGTGIDRHELFVDARDISEEDDDGNQRPDSVIQEELQARGERDLNEMQQEQFLEGQILTNSPFVYEEDYDLGDIVTVQNKDWGVTMDARITEIKEIYEESGLQIEAVFGNDRPTIIDQVRRRFNQMSPEIRK